MLDLQPLLNWQPDKGIRNLTTIDAHTGGEPFRVVTGGVGPIPGKTILEKRRWAQRNLEPVRRALMWEPRGHADMYGCFVTEPEHADSDIGVLFLHNEGYSSMCGHGIIALMTVLDHTGALPSDTLRIDTPAGTVTATRKAAGISFENVPSFVARRDAVIHVDGLGPVRYDLAFGGAFYAFVDAGPLGIELVPSSFRTLIEAGRAIKHAVIDSHAPVHPFEPDLSFLYGTIFTGQSPTADVHSRHVCVFADGEVDRSPTGTGVSARVALLNGSEVLNGTGASVRIDSIVGSVFTGSIAGSVRFGSYDAVVPTVSGRAHVCGASTWILDPEDPFVDGFFLR